MRKTKERRTEERQHYKLPVSFTEDQTHTDSEGVIVDISSRGMAFSCSTNQDRPHPGQQLITHFRLPAINTVNPSNMKSFTRKGHVCRVDTINSDRYRVAVQFDEPPPFWDIPPTQ